LALVILVSWRIGHLIHLIIRIHSGFATTSQYSFISRDQQIDLLFCKADFSNGTTFEVDKSLSTPSLKMPFDDRRRTGQN